MRFLRTAPYLLIGAFAGWCVVALRADLRPLPLAPLATAWEAIAAATRRPAERLHKQDVFGTIAPGRAADLLVLSADPVADIRNIRRIERVMARGIVYEPDALLAGRSSR